MEIFKLFGSIFVETDKATENIKTTGKQMDKFSDKMSDGVEKAGKFALGLGVAMVGAGTAVFAATNKISEQGDEIDKMSQKMGISAEAYQKWAYVLDQNGMEVDKLKTGMTKLNNTFDEAKNGSSTAQATFEKLGLSMDDLNGMSREDMFKTVVNSLQGVSDESEKAALAYDIFGKSGTEMAPLLNQSADATNELMTNLEDMGAVMSDEAVKDSAAFNDQLGDLKQTFGGMATSILQDLLPVITNIMGYIQEQAPIIKQHLQELYDNIYNIIDFVINHKTLVEVIGVLIGGIIALMVAFNIQQAFIKAGLTINTALTWLQVTATTALSTAMAFLTSPIAIVIIAITALIAIGVLLYNNWDTISAFAIETWGNIKEAIGDAIDGIIEFFNNLVDSAVEKFNNIKTTITNVFDNIKTSVSNTITNAKNTWLGIFDALKNRVSDVFNDIQYKITHPVETAKTAVKNMIDQMKGFFNFNWSLPHIKLPHFSVSGSANPMNWFKQGVPKLNVDWYKQGGILTKPTIFGMNGDKAMAGGEAGAEAVLPIEHLDDVIINANNKGNNEILNSLPQMLYEAVVSAMKEINPTIILDDEKMGKFVLDRVEKELTF